MKNFVARLFTLLALASSVPLIAQDAELPDPAIIAARTDALVAAYQDLDIFSGVVLIAREGTPLYNKAFGLANREKNRPNTTETLFDIGSMNKTFTRVVVYQLAGEGKLQLDDPLGQYLEGFPEKVTQKVTIRHLLDHASGFGDYHGPDFFDAPRSERTIAGVVAKARTMPLLFEPGTEREYSNTGYVLLGAVIEKVTGNSYYQEVRNRIVRPLQLRHTHLQNTKKVKGRAVGYFKSPSGQLRDNRGFMEMPKPDGGFLSTAADVLTFYQAFHYGDRLLSDELRAKDPFHSFFEKVKNEPFAAIPHAGGYEGANTAYYEIPSLRLSIIVFANMDEPVAELLADGILDILKGKEPNPPVLPAVQNVYRAFQEHGPAYVKEHFEELTVNFHPADPKDWILNAVGYDLLSTDRTDEAIAVFQLNVELFPEVANGYDSLGEAWLKKGDKQKALKYYRKALELYPDLPSAREMVEKLEEG